MKPFARKQPQPRVVPEEVDVARRAPVRPVAERQLTHPRVDVLERGRGVVLGDVEDRVEEGRVRARREGLEAGEGDGWRRGEGGEGEGVARIDDSAAQFAGECQSVGGDVFERAWLREARGRVAK